VLRILPDSLSTTMKVPSGLGTTAYRNDAIEGERGRPAFLTPAFPIAGAGRTGVGTVSCVGAGGTIAG
jgi:hypothetical protein